MNFNVLKPVSKLLGSFISNRFLRNKTVENQFLNQTRSHESFSIVMWSWTSFSKPIKTELKPKPITMRAVRKSWKCECITSASIQHRQRNPKEKFGSLLEECEEMKCLSRKLWPVVNTTTLLCLEQKTTAGVLRVSLWEPNLT